MNYLITGGCGFLGSNLAARVLADGGQLFVFDNLSRTGASENLEWLKSRGKFNFLHADIRNLNDVEVAVKTAKPDVIFHLAGQVAMTTSIQNPRLDFEINTLGSHNLLETVRKLCPETPIMYSSTNKVYGDLEELEYTETSTRYEAPAYPNGLDETVRLDFRSPYGCSKGAADQYMLDYARIFGLKTIVFRHSSIFGGRQFSSFDQGWIGWFVRQALLKSEFTISGNGKQVRDVLFANDLVDLYMTAAQKANQAKGNAFNIGGGKANSLSLLELFAFLERELGHKMVYKQLPWRQSDQKVFVADISKADRILGWKPQVSKEIGLKKMIQWVQDSHSLK